MPCSGLLLRGLADENQNKNKELGFETNVNLNFNNDTKKALSFNRGLLMENFIIPNRLKFPLFRNILEKYFL